jgi:nucleotide-binding universal stress UspA family protein
MADMYKKIVVCLDGSVLAEQVLPYAAELALRCDSAVVLLRAVSEPVFASPGIPGSAGVPIVTSGMEKQVEKAADEAEVYLKSVAEQLFGEHGIRAECVTALGTAGQAIVDYATANGVELIALATHGRSGPGRVLFGSVADHVTRQSRLPILLVRPVVPESR